MFITKNYNYQDAVQKITQIFKENTALKDRGLPIAVLYKGEKYNEMSAFMIYPNEDGDLNIFDTDGNHYGTIQENLENTKGQIFIFEEQE